MKLIWKNRKDAATHIDPIWYGQQVQCRDWIIMGEN